MSKTILILRGPCGAGKTHFWKQHEQDLIEANINYQYIDLLDYVREFPDWEDRINHVISLVKESETQYIVIEAIFGINSPSYFVLMRGLKHKANIPLDNIQNYIALRPYKDCKRGVKKDTERNIQKRLDLLGKYWEAFDSAATAERYVPNEFISSYTGQPIKSILEV